MKRTTVVLPEELATLVELERKRRDVSPAEVIRSALAVYFGIDSDLAPRELPFIGIGSSGGAHIASRIEELLAEEWPKRRMRKLGRDSDP